MLSAHEVAAALREMGRYYGIIEKSPHRARAYEKAASAVEALGDRVGPLAAAGRLTEVPGIGDKLAEVIRALHVTGHTRSLDKLRASFPSALLELVGRRGFTLARLRTLYEALDVRDTDGLRRALDEGRLRGLKGFGPAVEARLREGLEEAESPPPAGALLVDALDHAEALLARLRAVEGVADVEVAGDVRRCAEIVFELPIVVAAAQPRAVLDAVVDLPEVGAVVHRDDSGVRLQHVSGLTVVVLAVPPERFGTGLFFATGSAAHVQAVAERAARAGVDLATSAFASEHALYASLQLCFIPPEVRDNDGEIAMASAGDDFADLVTLADLRGAVHCHTTHSDGKHSIAQMADAAADYGLSFITITDHSTSAPYAGGLTPDRLTLQRQEIESVQRHTMVEVLAGTESDINEDGSLDYPLSMLLDLDVIVASVHNRHRMDAAAMTERLIKAFAAPVFKIWGHPLGRLLANRPPFACDVEAVLDAAAAGRTAVEINGSPHRLDLEPALCKQARRRGLKFVISADAHSTRELDNLRFGVMMARRAGLRRADVLNTQAADDFRAAVRP